MKCSVHFQVRIQQLQSTLDTLDGDVDRLAEQKQLRMVDLLSNQQKTKYYQQVRFNPSKYRDSFVSE
jgi:hypothetical protein